MSTTPTSPPPGQASPTPTPAIERIGGLDTITAGQASAAYIVVVLHGLGMQAADFAPFASALGGDAWYLFPNGPVTLACGGRAWWPGPETEAELSAHARAIAPSNYPATGQTNQPRELAPWTPAGRSAAQQALLAFVADVQARAAGRPCVFLGYSQGGMLLMDVLLCAGMRCHAVALMSACRIAWGEWQGNLSAVAGLPMLCAHGTNDDNIAFAAGEALRDAAIAGGADVQWLAHDAGHSVPMLVWRKLRGFVKQVVGG